MMMMMMMMPTRKTQLEYHKTNIARIQLLNNEKNMSKQLTLNTPTAMMTNVMSAVTVDE
jgi:hypothetical protein